MCPPCSFGRVIVRRKWIDISALVLAGVVVPVVLIAIAFMVSREGDDDTTPPTSTTTVVTSESTTTATRSESARRWRSDSLNRGTCQPRMRR